jgi:hypothetical protein
MFDIFYSGPKPNLFAHEQAARDIDHARELSRTRYFWWVNYLTDYTGFDFLWEPVPWESHQRHVWPSQHQQNGGTELVPKAGYVDTNYTHTVLQRTGNATILGIDHGEGVGIECEYTVRYVSDYLGTLHRLLSKTDSEYAWVVSSVCDYTYFNFTWHPDEWQAQMLHVFPSDRQKFGDTFYIHVPTFLKQSADIKLLEWYNGLNFIENIMVPRRPMPVVEHTHDTHVTAIMEHEFVTPLVMFSTGGSTVFEPTVSLWQARTKTVVPLTRGAGVTVVPREAKTHLRRQVYDYPYIDKSYARGQEPLLDIVFIDNGETGAEHNYIHLKWAAERANNIRIHRSSGVTGRVAAYQAAARLSTTPWFFAVFAKLHVSDSFDWTWQPDRLQEPKHYIFHAYNPVNGLEYGHMSMIAYNKKLVLENTALGLDFTLDQAHEVVPLLSGQADYQVSNWMAWRTAFRECIKLQASLPDVENEYRLKQWLTVDHSSSKYSQKGAEDAVEYYEAVGGDFDALKKSYDWAWLASYALIKRNLTPHQ